MLKRVISIALVLMLVVSCCAGLVSAENASYTAKLGFANSDWSAQEWGDNANTTVTGPGEYSISWNGAASNALVFVVDIAGAGADFAAAGIKLTALSVVADGVEIPVDVTKVVTGDLENNGNWRIEIYNEYGSTKENAPVDPAAVTFASNLTVNFTLSGPATYTAKLGFANSDWSAQEWGDNANTTVTGAGEYSISWNGAASNALVFVVDIEGAAADFAAESLGLTALSVVADGVEIPVDLSKVVTGDLEEKGNYRIEIFNEYGSTKENAPIDPAAVAFASNLTVNFTIGTVAAEGKYELFIAYGGDKAAENDWLYQYYGDPSIEQAAGITATHAKIDEGQTATVSLSFAEPNFNSWFFAPCLVGTGIVDEIGDIDFTITCKIDGVEVPVDMAADAEGKTWWSEGTGNYAASDCIRLAGGYNEWATKYIAEPAGFSTIEYTITINSISEPVEPGAEVETGDTYELFIAYGGDKAAENDWGWSYEGVDKEGITAVKATIKAGETATISLTFAEPVFNSWYFAPCLVGEDVSLVSTVDFTVVCKIDGVEVPVNMGADPDGKTWWTEGTGSYTAAQCIRLAGGYNEWATQYIEKPGQFTTIEYTITLNSVKETTPIEEEPTIVEIDKNGTYNAYLMIQTPGWTFRNAWDDEFYGINGSGWADINNQWGNYMVHTDAEKAGMTWGKITDTVIAGNGTYSVSITDFGTIFADDFTNNNQEYFNILAVSTDLPAGADVTVTNVQLYVDGQLRHEYPEAYINTESTSLQILVQNIWNADVKELNYYPAPTESLEIRFTISGFAYDKAEEPGDTPADPTEPSAPADPSEPSEPAPSSPVTGIVIAAIVVVAVVVVVVVVLKKKKQ